TSELQGDTQSGGNGAQERSSVTQDQTNDTGQRQQFEPSAASLRLRGWERDFIKKLYPLIMSPRSAKRFVNLYRLIRVSIADEGELRAFIGNRVSGQHRAALVLLALLTGYPDEADEIFHELLREEHSETWWEFIANIEASKRSTQPDPSIDDRAIARCIELIEK